MQTSETKHEEILLLPANKSRDALKNLDGWQATTDNKMIYREFILRDFMSAVDMIDGIASIAQKEKHHPDIHLTQFRNLRVTLTTHDVGGLSEKDFTVATKVNEMSLDGHEHPTPHAKPVKKPHVEKLHHEKAPVKKAAVKKTKAKAKKAKKRI